MPTKDTRDNVSTDEQTKQSESTQQVEKKFGVPAKHVDALKHDPLAPIPNRSRDSHQPQDLPGFSPDRFLEKPTGISLSADRYLEKPTQVPEGQHPTIFDKDPMIARSALKNLSEARRRADENNPDRFHRIFTTMLAFEGPPQVQKINTEPGELHSEDEALVYYRNHLDVRLNQMRDAIRGVSKSSVNELPELSRALDSLRAGEVVHATDLPQHAAEAFSWLVKQIDPKASFIRRVGNDFQLNFQTNELRGQIEANVLHYINDFVKEAYERAGKKYKVEPIREQESQSKTNLGDIVKNAFQGGVRLLQSLRRQEHISEDDQREAEENDDQPYLLDSGRTQDRFTEEPRPNSRAKKAERYEDTEHGKAEAQQKRFIDEQSTEICNVFLDEAERRISEVASQQFTVEDAKDLGREYFFVIETPGAEFQIPKTLKRKYVRRVIIKLIDLSDPRGFLFDNSLRVLPADQISNDYKEIAKEIVETAIQKFEKIRQ